MTVYFGTFENRMTVQRRYIALCSMITGGNYREPEIAKRYAVNFEKLERKHHSRRKGGKIKKARSSDVL